MIDVHQAILDLQERELLGQMRQRSGENLMFSCPFIENHGGKMWQRTPSFGIRESDAPGRPAGAWNCFSCHTGSKDIADLRAMLTGETAEEVQEDLGNKEVIIDDLVAAVHRLDERIQLATECLTDWPATTPIAASPLASSYLLGRNVGLAEWERFGLEWFGGATMPARKDKPLDEVGKKVSTVRGERIIIPVWWEGRRIGYSSRAAGYETDMKYYRPVSNMQTTLYDPGDILREPTDLIFVLEGEFDCWAALREGLPAVSSWGSGLTRHQAKMLQRFRRVVFLYDQDKAGVRGVARISEMFGGMLHWRALWLPAGYDAAKMAPGWGKEVLDVAQKPAPDRGIAAMLSAIKGV